MIGSCFGGICDGLASGCDQRAALGHPMAFEVAVGPQGQPIFSVVRDDLLHSGDVKQSQTPDYRLQLTSVPQAGVSGTRDADGA